MAHRRIQKELKDIERNCPSDHHFQVVGNDVLVMEGHIIGPTGSPYADGVYKLSIACPSDYPFKPPHIKMLTEIYHPNINNGGEMKLALLNRGNWSPMTTLSKVCVDIIELLRMPNANEDVLRPHIAELIRNDRAQFIRTASEWNMEHARAGGSKSLIDDSWMDAYDVELAAFNAVSVGVMDARYAMLQQCLCQMFGNALGDAFGKVVRLYYGQREVEIRKCVDANEVMYGAQQGPPSMQLFCKTPHRNFIDFSSSKTSKKCL